MPNNPMKSVGFVNSGAATITDYAVGAGRHYVKIDGLTAQGGTLTITFSDKAAGTYVAIQAGTGLAPTVDGTIEFDTSDGCLKFVLSWGSTGNVNIFEQCILGRGSNWY